jgi:hypothetical protein
VISAGPPGVIASSPKKGYHALAVFTARFRLLGRRQEGDEDLERGYDGGGGGSERVCE